MKKRTLMVVGLILSLSLLVAGSAFARWGDGYGMRGGSGINCWSETERPSADPETMAKFRRETLPLRDELIVKRLELSQEYDKENPEDDRIAQLRDEIVDIETNIQEVAEKYGFDGFGKGRRGKGGYGRGIGNCAGGCY
jgi:hypothetical protein